MSGSLFHGRILVEFWKADSYGLEAPSLKKWRVCPWSEITAMFSYTHLLIYSAAVYVA